MNDGCSTDRQIFKLTVVSLISILATANLSPDGSRPMAKQKSITCITGNAKMNSITPTLRHMRKKFFCNKARIFPRVVIYPTKEKIENQISSSCCSGTEYCYLHWNILTHRCSFRRMQCHRWDCSRLSYHSTENRIKKYWNTRRLWGTYPSIFKNMHSLMCVCVCLCATLSLSSFTCGSLLFAACEITCTLLFKFDS